ncbi:MAG: DUF2007 domain-containing protein [Verrucomicrobia bacterium]|nr:DUF2007 domain-containing protein [Verrucomicrobiota bacterium]
MTTVGRFLRQADASLALSRLQAEGIEGFLFDEISLSVVGAGMTAIPIRLEVADEDAERALRILRGEEGAGPLPDDFVPPEGAEGGEGNFPKVTAKELGSAFITGGVMTLITIGLPGLAAMVGGMIRPPTIGGVLLLFAIGGVGGVIMHVYREGQKEAAEAEERPDTHPEPPNKTDARR